MPRRFRASEFLRMEEAGIFAGDEHVELLEGQIVVTPPQGEPHAIVIERLTRLLIQHLDERYRVRPQLPLTAGEASVPEPDLAVLAAEKATSRKRHPSRALLVIEVASSSLAHDRELKGRIYARARIPEYWLVDVGGESVEVYTAPSRSRYQHVRTVKRKDTLVSAVLPRLSFPVRTLFV
ncbi:MAG: Uma2 family endonuclease [Myxococcaceae bacterium]|nr:Uma2 family endonuclease [Myxococcaceae bacterium]MCI0672814.1 Uma2 family endonuclease [Myxococcaceae bacterium]